MKPSPSKPVTKACADTAETQRRLELAASLTGKLSHDFGNYLTGIMGFTELSMFQLAPDSVSY